MRPTNVMKFESPAEMSVAALSSMASYSLSVIKAKGKINIAISGGCSPLGLFALIGKPGNLELLPWCKVHFFWVDERFVPVNHEENNYGLACETFLDKIRMPKANVHPIKTDFTTASDSAQAYREELENYFGEPLPVFDLVMLGLGADGHTGSLFPMAKSLKETKLSVIDTAPPVSSEPKLPRITMTLPVINKARKVYVITAGAEKQHVIDYVLDETSKEIKYPVQLIDNPSINWYISKQ